MMFKHFDKEKSGKLNHQEFKSCLRALGYDLPMVEEGQPDPEFDAILGTFADVFIVNLFVKVGFSSDSVSTERSRILYNSFFPFSCRWDALSFVLDVFLQTSSIPTETVTCPCKNTWPS